MIIVSVAFPIILLTFFECFEINNWPFDPIPSAVCLLNPTQFTTKCFDLGFFHLLLISNSFDHFRWDFSSADNQITKLKHFVIISVVAHFFYRWLPPSHIWFPLNCYSKQCFINEINCIVFFKKCVCIN